MQATASICFMMKFRPTRCYRQRVGLQRYSVYNTQYTGTGYTTQKNKCQKIKFKNVKVNVTDMKVKSKTYNIRSTAAVLLKLS